MEEQQHIKLDEVSETEKPKSNFMYKIAFVCLTILFYLFVGIIKNPKAFNEIRSTICVYRASRIIKNAGFIDSINVYPKLNKKAVPLLNKAILLNDNNWHAWVLKGGTYTCQWIHLDSAAMCLRKTIQLQEEQGVPVERREDAYIMLIICLWRAHLPREALDVAMEGVNLFPTNKEMKRKVRLSVKQYYKEVIETSDTIQDEISHASIHKIVLLADTLCQNNFIEDAVWVLRNTYHKYPDNEKLKDTYADFLLAYSEDTRSMWYLSRDIWDVDRKRALKMFRKCARLGDKRAQEWLIENGYEWD